MALRTPRTGPTEIELWVAASRWRSQANFTAGPAPEPPAEVDADCGGGSVWCGEALTLFNPMYSHLIKSVFSVSL